MKKLIASIFILILVVSNAHAVIRYADPAGVQIGIGWDGVDGHEYIGTAGTGLGYSTFEEAEAARKLAGVKGDKIYLRNGTYQESWGGTGFTDGAAAYLIDPSIKGTSWNEGDYNHLASYPGEWAILDAQGAAFGLGIGVDYWNESYSLEYWSFERLEVINAYIGGLNVTKGPVKIRFNRFFNNKQLLTGGNNPAGLRAHRLQDSIIEFNEWIDNGCVDVNDNNCSQISIFSDYGYRDLDPAGYFSINNRRNKIRYNKFDTTGSNIYSSIKDKAVQLEELGAEDGYFPVEVYLPNYVNKAWGNEIDHNIIKKSTHAIVPRQEFSTVHNNIVDGGGITGEDGSSTWPIRGLTIYNNTTFGGYINTAVGNNMPYPLLKLDFVAENNIVSEFGTAEYSPSIGIATMQCWAVACDDQTAVYDWDNTSVDFNMIYQPLSATQHIGLPKSYAHKSTRWIDTDEFNTLQSTTNDTSDTAGLFLGASGVNKYKIDPDFVFLLLTMGTGGSGSPHPWLPDVTFPTYVGAVNPDDDAWVQGVEDLGAPYFLTVLEGSTPIWIEAEATNPIVTLQSDFESTSPTSYTGSFTVEAGRTGTLPVSLNGFTVTCDDGDCTDEETEAFTVTGVTVPITDVITVTDSSLEEGNDSITITLPTPSTDVTVGSTIIESAILQ